MYTLGGIKVYIEDHFYISPSVTDLNILNACQSRARLLVYFYRPQYQEIILRVLSLSPRGIKVSLINYTWLTDASLPRTALHLCMPVLRARGMPISCNNDASPPSKHCHAATHACPSSPERENKAFRLLVVPSPLSALTLQISAPLSSPLPRSDSRHAQQPLVICMLLHSWVSQEYKHTSNKRPCGIPY